MDLFKSFISLLALINPVGAIPFFPEPDAAAVERNGAARSASPSISVFCVIAVTALLGQQIIDFFGISVGSLEVGGGIIMLLMALNMLNAQVGNARSHAGRAHGSRGEEQHRGRAARDSAADRARVDQHGDRLCVELRITGTTGSGCRDRRGIAALCFGALNLAEPIARWVGRTGINIGTRLMGLMLSALAVEFIVDGLKALLPNLK